MTSRTLKAKRREIDRAMSEDAGWRNGVQSLALEFHHAIGRLEPPELAALAYDVTDRLAQSLIEQTAAKGLRLTDDTIDDLVNAMFSAALDMVDGFPISGGPQ